MENPKPIKINRIRYWAASYFVLIALINIADSFANNRQVKVFDIILLAFVTLPLLINKRLFIFGYGLLAAALSFPLLLFYLVLFNPKVDNYLLEYFFGIVVFLLAFVSSLALLYVGTYSKEKGRFRLI